MHFQQIAENRCRCASWIAPAVLMGIALMLVCSSGALADETAESIHGWPTFVEANSTRPMVMSSSVPPPVGLGNEAPATAPLPPGVLTGGMLLGAQWVVLRFHKSRRI